MRCIAMFAALAFTLACAGPAAHVESAPAASPRSRSPVAPSTPESTATAPEPAGAAPESEPSPEPTPVCARLVWVDACAPERPFAQREMKEISEWFSERGAQPPTIDVPPACWEAELGQPALPGLWCERIVHATRGKPGAPGYVYRVLTHLTLYVARGKRAAVVLDVPVAVNVLDAEEPSGPLFALELEPSDSSRELQLREPRAGACDEAGRQLDELREKEQREPDPDARKVMTAWVDFDRQLLGRVCKAQGEYGWQNGRYRVRPPPRNSSL